MKFPRADHPVWGILEKVAIVTVVFLVEWAYAGNFDVTEGRTIGGAGGVAALLMGREALQWLRGGGSS